jgi:hypothetical protein
VRNARPKKAVPADPQIAEELLQRPHPWLDARPDAESLLEKIPLNILSRKERAEALAAADKAANKGMSLEDQIDRYARAGREAVEKIQYLSACDRHRIEVGLMMEGEKERVKDYPIDVRVTISRMLAETASLFTTIGIPDCAEELLHRRKLSEQGRAARKPKEWHVWAEGKLCDYVQENPQITITRALNKLAKEPDIPEKVAFDQRKVVSKLLKEIKSKPHVVPPA